MSLFSSKVWWENKPGNVEEFDVGGLCVANVDNDPSGAGLVSHAHCMHAHLQVGAILISYLPLCAICLYFTALSRFMLQTRL